MMFDVYITQVKYCQKLAFEADLINKMNTLIIETSVFDLKINYILLFFYSASKILPKIGFRSGPY